MKKTLLLTLLAIFVALRFISAQNISLNGKWSICIDPMGKGVEYDWHEDFSADQSGLVKGWDVVNVPHCFTLDSRYNITGRVWYRRTFNLPEDIGDKVCRIRFSAVFYKARVWINGIYIGTHEGGYTPFVYDLSRVIKPGINTISVEADNRWDETTVPGARPGSGNDLTDPSFYSYYWSTFQIYPWYEYGGITQDVNLLITDKTFITKQKIEPLINLEKNTAVVDILTWVNMHTDKPQKMSIEGFIAFADSPNVPVANFTPKVVDAVPYLENLIRLSVNLNESQLKLWDFDQPVLYMLTTIIKSGSYSDTIRTRTGLRDIKVSEGQLLLNGQPIRLGGANRHRDFPGYGSMDPLKVVETDLGLMKEGNMILSRIHHYPANEVELDWADENGLLFIEEIPNWQFRDVQLADPMMQARIMLQAKEMVERDWNRPSVIGWSGGNEFHTCTPQADAYTKVICDYFRSIDPTRLASVVSWSPAASAENVILPYNSFRFCDIICINYYLKNEDLEKSIIRLHENFPDKAIMITEFSDISNLSVIRKYPFIVGASRWSFNDYLSRWTATASDGYRSLGTLTPDREKRELYNDLQREFCPLLIEKGNNTLKLTARTDFPSFIVKDYKVRLKTNNKILKEWTLPTLKPGMSHSIEYSKKFSAGQTIEICNSKGFVVYQLK